MNVSVPSSAKVCSNDSLSKLDDQLKYVNIGNTLIQYLRAKDPYYGDVEPLLDIIGTFFTDGRSEDDEQRAKHALCLLILSYYPDLVDEPVPLNKEQGQSTAAANAITVEAEIMCKNVQISFAEYARNQSEGSDSGWVSEDELVNETLEIVLNVHIPSLCQQPIATLLHSDQSMADVIFSALLQFQTDLLLSRQQGAQLVALFFGRIRANLDCYCFEARDVFDNFSYFEICNNRLVHYEKVTQGLYKLSMLQDNLLTASENVKESLLLDNGEDKANRSKLLRAITTSACDTVDPDQEAENVQALFMIMSQLFELLLYKYPVDQMNNLSELFLPQVKKIYSAQSMIYQLLTTQDVEKFSVIREPNAEGLKEISKVLLDLKPFQSYREAVDESYSDALIDFSLKLRHCIMKLIDWEARYLQHLLVGGDYLGVNSFPDIVYHHDYVKLAQFDNQNLRRGLYLLWVVMRSKNPRLEFDGKAICIQVSYKEHQSSESKERSCLHDDVNLELRIATDLTISFSSTALLKPFFFEPQPFSLFVLGILSTQKQPKEFLENFFQTLPELWKSLFFISFLSQDDTTLVSYLKAIVKEKADEIVRQFRLSFLQAVISGEECELLGISSPLTILNGDGYGEIAEIEKEKLILGLDVGTVSDELDDYQLDCDFEITEIFNKTDLGQLQVEYERKIEEERKNIEKTDVGSENKKQLLSMFDSLQFESLDSLKLKQRIASDRLSYLFYATLITKLEQHKLSFIYSIDFEGKQDFHSVMLSAVFLSSIGEMTTAHTVTELFFNRVNDKVIHSKSTRNEIANYADDIDPGRKEEIGHLDVQIREMESSLADIAIDLTRLKSYLKQVNKISKEYDSHLNAAQLICADKKSKTNDSKKLSARNTVAVQSPPATGAQVVDNPKIKKATVTNMPNADHAAKSMGDKASLNTVCRGFVEVQEQKHKDEGLDPVLKKKESDSVQNKEEPDPVQKKADHEEWLLVSRKGKSTEKKSVKTLTRPLSASLCNYLKDHTQPVAQRNTLFTDLLVKPTASNPGHGLIDKSLSKPVLASLSRSQVTCSLQQMEDFVSIYQSVCHCIASLDVEKQHGGMPFNALNTIRQCLSFVKKYLSKSDDKQRVEDVLSKLKSNNTSADQSPSVQAGKIVEHSATFNALLSDEARKIDFIGNQLSSESTVLCGLMDVVKVFHKSVLLALSDRVIHEQAGLNEIHERFYELAKLCRKLSIKEIDHAALKSFLIRRKLFLLIIKDDDDMMSEVHRTGLTQFCRSFLPGVNYKVPDESDSRLFLRDAELCHFLRGMLSAINDDFVILKKTLPSIQFNADQLTLLYDSFYLARQFNRFFFDLCQAHDQVQNQYLEKDFDLDVECFAGFAYINIPPAVFMSFGRGDFYSRQLITNFTRHIERIVTLRTVFNLRELSTLCDRYGDVASQLYQQFDKLIHSSLDLGESTDPHVTVGADPIMVKLVTAVLSRVKKFKSDVFSMVQTINSYRDGFQVRITTVAESILQSRVDQEAVRRLEALNYPILWSSNPMFFEHPGAPTTVNPSPMLPFSFNAHNGFFSQTPGLSQLPVYWGYNPINPSG